MKTFTLRYFRFAVLLVGILLFVGGIAAAEPASKPAAEQADKPDARSKDGAAKETSDDLYQVPATDDPKELFAYIDKVQEFRPRTRASFMTHRAKGTAAIEAAAEKILKLEKDPNSENSQKANELLLEFRIAGIGQAAPERQKAVLEQFEKSLEGRQLTTNDLRTAMSIATTTKVYGRRRASRTIHMAQAPVCQQPQLNDRRVLDLGFQFTRTGEPLVRESIGLRITESVVFRPETTSTCVP